MEHERFVKLNDNDPDLVEITVDILDIIQRTYRQFGMPEPDTFITDNYSCSEELYRSALEMQTVENIAEVLAEQTDAAGCHCESIVPFINISEDMSISIIRVEIEAEDFESAAAVVRSSLGTDTEVVNGSDG